MASSRCARRATTALLWAALSCLVIQGALAFYISACRPDLADPHFGPRLVLLRRLLAREPGRPLLIVLGSSRAANGFAADMLPPPGVDSATTPIVFNLGMHASGPFRELLNMRRLLHAGIRPQAVVVEVLPALLYSDGKSIQHDGYLDPGEVYRTDLDVCRRYAPAQAARYRMNWLLSNCFPSYSSRVLLLEHYAPDWLPPDVASALEDNKLPLSEHGWEPRLLRGPLNRALALKIAREAYGPLLQFDAVNPITDRVMHELLGLCRSQGIEITALIAMPEGRQFRCLYSHITEQVVDSYLTSLSAAYGTRFVDARNWIDVDEWLVDAHHLLPVGAEMFTAQFWQHVMRPAAATPEAPLNAKALVRR